MDLTSIPETEWARLAAYIDGEGCISIAKRSPIKGRPNGFFHMSLNVSNTDRRLPNHLRVLFGGAISLACAQKKGCKECWNWCANNVDVEEILTRCLPYLLIKREQAIAAILFRKTIAVGSERRLPTSKLVFEGRRILADLLTQIKQSHLDISWLPVGEAKIEPTSCYH